MKYLKYVLEDFLERLKKLTPIQTSRQNFTFKKFNKKGDFKILKETKILHQKTKDLSKIQIIESSILFIILNNLGIASKKIEDLSDLAFLSEKNESLKNTIISSISKGQDSEKIETQIKLDYAILVSEISENSNIQLITKNKNDQEILNILEELINDFREQNNLLKIESLEKKLINNLDENSYSELIRLKSQLNRD